MNAKLSLFLMLIFMITPTLAGRRYVGYIAQNGPKDKIKEHFQANGGQCLTGNLYNLVRKNDDAMSYYNDAVCSLKQNQTAKAYMAATYGTYVKNLGAGTFGVVDLYKAANGKFYAVKKPKSLKIKLLFEELNASACIRELLDDKCELRRNFAMIIQCVKHDSLTVNLVMHYYPSTLENKINSKYTTKYNYRSDDEKLEVLGDMKVITEEMQLLHSVKLAHRDLKPENVMVDQDGRPIMVDFGFTTPNFNLAKTQAGTPLYIDFLIIQKRGNGQMSDLYALALIFFEMTHGKGSNKKIESMVLAGGYPNSWYNPNINMLKLLPDFTWLAKFTKKSNRWNIKQMLAKINQMIEDVKNPAKKNKKQVMEAVNQQTKQNNLNVSPKIFQPYNAHLNNNQMNQYPNLVTQKVQPMYKQVVNPKPLNVNYNLYQKPGDMMLNNITRNIYSAQKPLKKFTPTTDIYGVRQQPLNTYFRKVIPRQIIPTNQIMGYPNYQFNNRSPFFVL